MCYHHKTQGGIMQIRFSHWTQIFLMTVIVLGSFSVNTFASVHAATSVAAHGTGQENTGQHSADHSTVVVLSNSQHDVFPIDVPRQEHLVNHPVLKDFLVKTTDRAPPTQKFLRSVMKRE
jgi:hypothetical protein